METFLGNKFVTHQELRDFDYVNRVELEQALEDSVSVPMGGGDGDMEVERRLLVLEHEILKPGGAFTKMESALKVLQSRKAGSAVQAGPYTFKDAPSTMAWATALGEPTLMRYFVDCRVLLASLKSQASTEASILQDEANAKKAGYNTATEASIASSFSITFPEAIFKASASNKDAVHGGMVFTSSFSSDDIFYGDSENSTKAEMVRKLETKRDQCQHSIDIKFPPDQTRHSKTHAVCSHILRKGYFQAIGFLESIHPFYLMMKTAGLTGPEAWGKCLTYSKALFLHIHEVHTVGDEKTAGTMIYGMLLATQLLEAYSEVGWIRHPDVSSALVVASLKREGNVVKAAIAQLGMDKELIHKNKKAIDTLLAEHRNLKAKNPNWNT